MQKIELDQGDSTCKNEEFSIRRRLRASNVMFWAHEHVLTYSVERFKWIEELASESNTSLCTGTRNYYRAEKIGASNQVKLYVHFGWFFIDNFGLMCSFGLTLFVDLESIIPDQGMLVRSPGKSICKRLNGTKVIEHVKNDESLDRETSPGLKCLVLGP